MKKIIENEIEKLKQRIIEVKKFILKFKLDIKKCISEIKILTWDRIKKLESELKI